jgi:hypothetical protein
MVVIDAVAADIHIIAVLLIIDAGLEVPIVDRLAGSRISAENIDVFIIAFVAVSAVTLFFAWLSRTVFLTVLRRFSDPRLALVVMVTEAVRFTVALVILHSIADAVSAFAVWRAPYLVFPLVKITFAVDGACSTVSSIGSAKLAFITDAYLAVAALGIMKALNTSPVCSAVRQPWILQFAFLVALLLIKNAASVAADKPAAAIAALAALHAVPCSILAPRPVRRAQRSVKEGIIIPASCIAFSVCKGITAQCPLAAKRKRRRVIAVAEARILAAGIRLLKGDALALYAGAAAAINIFGFRSALHAFAKMGFGIFGAIAWKSRA